MAFDKSRKLFVSPGLFVDSRHDLPPWFPIREPDEFVEIEAFFPFRVLSFRIYTSPASVLVIGKVWKV